MDKGYEQMPKFGWEPVTSRELFPDGESAGPVRNIILGEDL